MFIKTIQRFPEKFHSMQELGEISLLRGQYDEAWQWASRAAGIAPKFYAPRAIQIALTVFLKKKRSIEKLIKWVPSRNKLYLREEIEEHLKYLGVIEHMAQIDLAMELVYGATSNKTAATQKKVKKTERNSVKISKRHKKSL